MKRKYRSVSGLQRILFVSFALLTILLIGPQAAQAEEAGSEESLPDRFMIRGGYAYVFGADTTFGINGTSGVGTSVDFSTLLKGKQTDNAWRIDSAFRFNPKHSIGFSYYNVLRKGNNTINADITVGDTTFAVGGQVSSRLNVGMYRFYYNYSFHHDDKVELAGSVGFYMADISTSLTGNLTCTGSTVCSGVPTTPGATSEKLLAPLPSVGFLVNYNFTPRLRGMGRFDWFYVDSGNFKGAMNEVYIGLEYRIFKPFAVGAAYDRLSINVDYEPTGESGWTIQNDWNMLYAFGSFYF